MAEDAAMAAAAVLIDDVEQDDAAPVDETGEQAAADTDTTDTEGAAVDFELPNFEADTSGLDFLDEPDFEEPEDEAAGYVDPGDEPDENEYEDPATAKLRSDLAKAQRQLKWEHDRRVNASTAEWRKEAARRFPLADVDEINADSRRSFMRAAHAQHVKLEQKLEPYKTALDKLRVQAVAEETGAAREKAEKAWGKPSAGPSVSEAEVPIPDPSRGRGTSLHDRTLARLKLGDKPGGIEI